MLSSSLNYHSLKAMLLRSTTLTAGRDFRRQGREVGGFCSQTQSASFLLGFVDGKRLRRFCRTSPVERHTSHRTYLLKKKVVQNSLEEQKPCKPYLRFHSTPYAVTCVIRVWSFITTSIPLAPSIRDDARLRERGYVTLCL
jgi:hypothetical protein